MLENNVVKLRALEPYDLDLLYRWENDTAIWLYSNTLVPFSRYVLQKYLEISHLDLYETHQLRLIIEAKDNDVLIPVGTIDLFDFEPFHKRVGIGILIAEQKHRRKSYASSALDLLLQYCFDHLLLHQVYCSISANNIPSLRLFKKKGFVVTGKKKNWLKTANGWRSEYFLQKINPAFV